MICSRTVIRRNGSCISRRIARGFIVALGAGILMASSSVVLSFEPAPQDESKTAAKPDDRKPKPKAKQAGGANFARQGKGGQESSSPARTPGRRRFGSPQGSAP